MHHAFDELRAFGMCLGFSRKTNKGSDETPGSKQVHKNRQRILMKKVVGGMDVICDFNAARIKMKKCVHEKLWQQYAETVTFYL